MHRECFDFNSSLCVKKEIQYPLLGTGVFRQNLHVILGWGHTHSSWSWFTLRCTMGCTDSTCALASLVKRFHGVWKQWKTLSQSLLFQGLMLSKHDCSFILLQKPGTYLQPIFLDSLFQVEACPYWSYWGCLRKGQNLRPNLTPHHPSSPAHLALTPQAGFREIHSETSLLPSAQSDH